MSKVVTTYIKYKRKRAEIKARQKVELDEQLKPFLIEFGDAVAEAQKEGKRIDDIEYEIGAKNRSLVYAAKRAAKGITTPEPTPTVPTSTTTPAEPPQSRVEILELAEDANGRAFEVYIESKFRGTVWVTEDGLDIPEEWAADTENSAAYREAVGQIRELAFKD